MMTYSYAERSAWLIGECIDALRNKPVNSTYLEKLILADEASALYLNEPQPLTMGKCMNYIAERCSCPVDPHDILVGRFAECIPTEEEEKLLEGLHERWQNNQLEDGTTFLRDGGHTTFDWEEILQLGLAGLEAKAAAELERRRQDGSEPERLVFLEGMKLVYHAYRRYIARYAEACEQAGMEKEAAMCRNLADNPPATFIEGMQLILFVTSIYSIYSARANATLTCGRMDDLLRAYYERDVASGILTREDAGYIIDDFNCKSAIILGRGEHQMSGASGGDTGWFRNPMYDSPTYVIIGGYSNHGDYLTNPLTKLFLERIHPRLENPVYVYRRTRECPADEWEIACDKLRQNSTLLIYNDEIVVPAMEKGGISSYDARDYTIHGCNWPDVAGLSINIRYIGGPIPQRIRASMFDVHGWPVKKFASIDEIYQKIEDDWRAEVREYFAEYRANNPEIPAVSEVLTCSDCFHRGTIEAATAAHLAVPYRNVLNLLRHVGTAADMMAALEAVVYTDNDPVDLYDMARALNANFLGYEEILKRCKNAPKYGRDDDAADKHAARLMKLLADVTTEESINPETGKRDIPVLCVTIADSNHLYVGNQMPATCDGRRAGEPISENLSPTKGNAESITAMLNSVTKIDFDRCTAGALNLRMPKNLVSGEDGLARLMILLETYFEDGGMQVQLSVADTAELRDAQVHPENYPDLMVRITGYSAVFIDMCRKAQDEIIKRDEVS
ncbi:MAG: hypothetical protein E7463_09300 [Ruminococcaceae bacterium]|nr:hypothetical protein [Oscillospiraceae bacterium]